MDALELSLPPPQASDAPASSSSKKKKKNKRRNSKNNVLSIQPETEVAGEAEADSPVGSHDGEETSEATLDKPTESVLIDLSSPVAAAAAASSEAHELLDVFNTHASNGESAVAALDTTPLFEVVDKKEEPALVVSDASPVQVDLNGSNVEVAPASTASVGEVNGGSDVQATGPSVKAENLEEQVEMVPNTIESALSNGLAVEKTSHVEQESGLANGETEEEVVAASPIEDSTEVIAEPQTSDMSKLPEKSVLTGESSASIDFDEPDNHLSTSIDTASNEDVFAAEDPIAIANEHSILYNEETLASEAENERILDAITPDAQAVEPLAQPVEVQQTDNAIGNPTIEEDISFETEVAVLPVPEPSSTVEPTKEQSEIVVKEEVKPAEESVESEELLVDEMLGDALEEEPPIDNEVMVDGVGSVTVATVETASTSAEIPSEPEALSDEVVECEEDAQSLEGDDLNEQEHELSLQVPESPVDSPMTSVEHSTHDEVAEPITSSPKETRAVQARQKPATATPTKASSVKKESSTSIKPAVSKPSTSRVSPTQRSVTTSSALPKPATRTSPRNPVPTPPKAKTTASSPSPGNGGLHKPISKKPSGTDVEAGNRLYERALESRRRLEEKRALMSDTIPKNPLPTPPKPKPAAPSPPPVPTATHKVLTKKPSGTDVEAGNRLYERALESRRRLEEKKAQLSETFTFTPQVNTRSKKLDNGDAPNRFLLLHERAKEAQRKKEELREKMASEAGTFKPQITTKAKRLATNSDKPRYENLYRNASEIQAKREEKKQELEKKEEEYTFKPKIRTTKSPVKSRPLYDEELIKQRRLELEQKKLEAEAASRPKIVKKKSSDADDKIFDRLYQAGQQRAERLAKLKQEREEQEKAKATFQPKVSAPGTKASTQPFHERLFDKDHLKRVALEREQKKLEEEKRRYSFKPQISDASEETKAKGSVEKSESRKSIFERLYSDKDRVKEKIEMSEELKVQKELEACTFRPHIDPAPTSGGKGETATPIWERLLSIDKNQIAEERERMKEQMELEACTFKPEIAPVPGSASPKRGSMGNIFERLSVSGGSTPVDDTKRRASETTSGSFTGKRLSYSERLSARAPVAQRRAKSTGDILKSTALPPTPENKIVGGVRNRSTSGVSSRPPLATKNITPRRSSARPSPTTNSTSSSTAPAARTIPETNSTRSPSNERTSDELVSHSKSILENYDAWAAKLEEKMRNL